MGANIPNGPKYNNLKLEDLPNSREELIIKLLNSSLKLEKLRNETIDLKRNILKNSVTSMKNLHFPERQKEIDFYNRNKIQNNSSIPTEELIVKHNLFLQNINKYDLLINELNKERVTYGTIKEKLKYLKHTNSSTTRLGLDTLDYQNTTIPERELKNRKLSYRTFNRIKIEYDNYFSENFENITTIQKRQLITIFAKKLGVSSNNGHINEDLILAVANHQDKKTGILDINTIETILENDSPDEVIKYTTDIIAVLIGVDFYNKTVTKIKELVKQLEDKSINSDKFGEQLKIIIFNLTKKINKIGGDNINIKGFSKKQILEKYNNETSINFLVGGITGAIRNGEPSKEINKFLNDNFLIKINFNKLGEPKKDIPTYENESERTFIESPSNKTINILIGKNLKISTKEKIKIINKISAKNFINDINSIDGQIEFKKAIVKYETDHHLGINKIYAAKIGNEIYHESKTGDINKRITDNPNLIKNPRNKAHIANRLYSNIKTHGIENSKNTKELLRLVKKHGDKNLQNHIELLGYDLSKITVYTTSNIESNEIIEKKELNSKLDNLLNTAKAEVKAGIGISKNTRDNISTLLENNVNLIHGLAAHKALFEFVKKFQSNHKPLIAKNKKYSDFFKTIKSTNNRAVLYNNNHIKTNIKTAESLPKGQLDRIKDSTKGALDDLLFIDGVKVFKYEDIINIFTQKNELDEKGVKVIKQIQGIESLHLRETGVINTSLVLGVIGLASQKDKAKELIELLVTDSEKADILIKLLDGTEEKDLDEDEKKLLKEIKKAKGFNNHIYQKIKLSLKIEKKVIDGQAPEIKIDDFKKLEGAEKTKKIAELAKATNSELLENGVIPKKAIAFYSKFALKMDKPTSEVNEEFILKVLEQQNGENTILKKVLNFVGMEANFLIPDGITGEFTTSAMILNGVLEQEGATEAFIGMSKDKHLLPLYNRIKKGEPLSEKDSKILLFTQINITNPYSIRYRILQTVVGKIKGKGENKTGIENKFLEKFDNKGKAIGEKFAQSEKGQAYLIKQKAFLKEHNLDYNKVGNLADAVKSGDPKQILEAVLSMGPEMVLIAALAIFFFGGEGSLWPAMGTLVVGLGGMAALKANGIDSKAIADGIFGIFGDKNKKGGENAKSYTTPSDNQQENIESGTDNFKALEGLPSGDYKDRMGEHSKLYQSSFNELKGNYKNLEKDKANKLFTRLSNNNKFKETSTIEINKDIIVLQKGGAEAKNLLTDAKYDNIKSENPKVVATFLQSLLAGNENASTGLDLFTGGPSAGETISRTWDKFTTWAGGLGDSLSRTNDFSIEGTEGIDLNKLKGKSIVELDKVDKEIIALLTIKIAQDFNKTKQGKTLEELKANGTIEVKEGKIIIKDSGKFNSLIGLWKTKISDQYKKYVDSSTTREDLLAKCPKNLKDIFKNADDESIKKAVKENPEDADFIEKTWAKLKELGNDVVMGVSTAAVAVGKFLHIPDNKNAEDRKISILNSEMNDLINKKENLIKTNKNLKEKIEKNKEAIKEQREIENNDNAKSGDRSDASNKKTELIKENKNLLQKIKENKVEIKKIKQNIRKEGHKFGTEKETKELTKKEIVLLNEQLKYFTKIDLEHFESHSDEVNAFLEHYEAITNVYTEKNNLEGFDTLKRKINEIRLLLRNNLITTINKRTNITKEDAEKISKISNILEKGKSNFGEILKGRIENFKRNYTNKINFIVNKSFSKKGEEYALKNDTKTNYSRLKKDFNKYEEIFDKLDLDKTILDNFKKALDNSDHSSLLETGKDYIDEAKEQGKIIIDSASGAVSNVSESVNEAGDEIGNKINELLIKVGLKEKDPIYIEIFGDIKDSIINASDLTAENIKKISDDFEGKASDYIEDIIEILEK